MCNRTDWPCIRPEGTHNAPKGCIHESATGSQVDDHHTDGGHG